MAFFKISNYKTKTQLIIGFSIVIFVFALAEAFSIVRIHIINTKNEFLYHNSFHVSNAIRDAEGGIYNLKSALKDVVLAENENQLNTALKKLEIRDQKVNYAFTEIYKYYSGIKLDIDNALKAYQNWTLIRKQIITLVLEGKQNEAKQLIFGESTEQVLVTLDKIHKMGELADRKALELHETSLNNEKINTLATILVLLVLLTLSIIISLFVSRSISKPITRFINKINPMINRVFNQEAKSETQLLEKLGNELYSSYEQLKSEYSFQQESLKSKIESEELFRELVDSSHSGMLILNTNKLVYINATFCRLTGYSYDELINTEQFSKNILSKENTELVNLEIKNMLEGEIDSSIIELNVIAKNKNIIKTRLWLRKISLGSKKMILALFEDISKLKDTENALIENEEKLNKVLDSFIDGIYVTAPDFTIEYLNKAMAQLIGRDKIGEKCYKAIHNLESKCEWCVFDKLELEKTIAYNHSDKNKKREFEIRNTLLENGSKISVYHNITEKIQKDIELNNSRNRYKRLADATFEGLCYIHNGKIIETNSQLANMLEYTPAELINTPLMGYVFDADKMLADKQMQSEYLGTDELRLIKKDRTLIHVDIRSKDVDMSGKKFRLSIIRDVTYRKQTEQRILKTIIDTEEKERKRFAEDLHDELGPHMSSIRLTANRLEKHNNNPEQIIEIANNLDIMVKEAIDHIRTISNMLMPSLLNDYGLLKALSSFCNRLNDTSQIKIELNPSELQTQLSKSLEIAIYRIVIELVNNSVTHAKAKLINIDFIQDNGITELTYKDNGIGFNLNKVIQNKTGMGLTNILHRIKTLESSYTFSSIPQKGIIFKFAFYPQDISHDDH